MKKDQSAKGARTVQPPTTLYLALELSNTKWKLAFSNGSKNRFVTINARDLKRFYQEVDESRKRLGLASDGQIMSCYEAGRDGFWIHRFLVDGGIENIVVDSASIEVNRRRRRLKTDRLDARKLVSMLMRYHGGEKKLWAVVRVPSVADEDARQLHRDLQVLKHEKTMHCSRISGLLVQQGINIKNPCRRKLLKILSAVCCWDGQPVPAELRVRIDRELERLQMVTEQIKFLEKERVMRLKDPKTINLKQVVKLQRLRGIGPQSSWLFVMEFFGWRQFRNRREIAALSGLAPTPYDSGSRTRDLGISKAGNPRVRAMSVEIAWAWLRFQPESKLSLWFDERFAAGGKRMRRIGIVAVARRLLIDLWRYLEKDIVPEGAILKSEYS
ncbi:MAG: IS110 family transposase [Deltaproteobacteria bacterium]|nr:IS110 family transposase [Deltaproteobacteria bacterium]